uniref:Uncharacterized protein n=1 Tax=Arundo donax TaxID=35708 RepID=A0A0A9EH42_ARUDO
MRSQALWSSQYMDPQLDLPMEAACMGLSILFPLQTHSTRLANSLTAISTEQIFGCAMPFSKDFLMVPRSYKKRALRWLLMRGAMMSRQ